MHPRLNVVTLAVRDLKTSLDFYRYGLGLPGKIIGTEDTDSVSGAAGAVAFFELQGGLILALYPRSDLIKDAKVSDAGGPSQVEFSLGYLTKGDGRWTPSSDRPPRRAPESPRHRASVRGGSTRAISRIPMGLWEIIYNRAMPARDE